MKALLAKVDPTTLGLTILAVFLLAWFGFLPTARDVDMVEDRVQRLEIYVYWSTPESIAVNIEGITGPIPVGRPGVEPPG